MAQLANGLLVFDKDQHCQKRQSAVKFAYFHLIFSAFLFFVKFVEFLDALVVSLNPFLIEVFQEWTFFDKAQIFDQLVILIRVVKLEFLILRCLRNVWRGLNFIISSATFKTIYPFSATSSKCNEITKNYGNKFLMAKWKENVNWRDKVQKKEMK